MPPSQLELLTIEEAAHFLRLSRNTVYGLCRAGRLPAAKIGREWRVRRSELEKLLGWTGEGPTARPMPRVPDRPALFESRGKKS
jgi:excisionase family DNA binding protein